MERLVAGWRCGREKIGTDAFACVLGRMCNARFRGVVLVGACRFLPLHLAVSGALRLCMRMPEQDSSGASHSCAFKALITCVLVITNIFKGAEEHRCRAEVA